MEEQDCYEYPSYASFMQFSPTNPYVEPDTVPTGYLIPPFVVNGQNGYQDDNYEPFDIITPYGAFELLGNWFDIVDGILPTITVVVQGAGRVFVKLLAVELGGLVVVEADNPPNLIDIIAGVVLGAENILDLNLDNVSLPPETARQVIFPVDTVGAGLHTIYITFLPILDDSSIPLRYGGGFRGVQLCDFVEQPTMGIENIRFDEASCELQTLVDGEWTIVSGWENWLNCVPDGGGGGGGSAHFKTDTLSALLGANYTNATSSYTNVYGFLYTPQHSKMMVICSNVNMSVSSSGVGEIKLQFNSINGIDANEISSLGTNNAAGREMQVVDHWQGLAIGDAYYINLMAKTSTGTLTINASSRLMFTIIEYDNIEDLFVEAVRISGEELQQKIGGTWITVSDSLKTLFDAVQATANTALTNANTAIATNATQTSQIAAIVTVNTAQAASLVALDGRLDTVETDLNSLITVDIPQLALNDAAHAADLFNLNQLVDAGFSNGVWSHNHGFTGGDGGYVLGSAGTGYSAGVGWISDSNGLEIVQMTSNIRENQLTHVKVTVVYNSAPTGTPEFQINGGAMANIGYNGVGVFSYGWYRVPNDNVDDIIINFAGSGDFKLIGANYLGRGNDNPFD